MTGERWTRSVVLGLPQAGHFGDRSRLEAKGAILQAQAKPTNTRLSSFTSHQLHTGNCVAGKAANKGMC